MVVLDCDGRLVGDGQSVFVVAEIGQNHQGDVTIAERLIEEAARVGVDCVKFQKSSLPDKYTSAVLNRRYESANSFGLTYGEHKAFLEFSEQSFARLKHKAESCGVLMTASAMDEVSLEFLLALGVPFLKIGSGDSNNPRLISKAAAKCNVPLVISTGMSELTTVRRLYSMVPHPFGLLQCTSAYPTSPADINLNVLDTYREAFPEAVIGYSGHEEGFLPTLGAVAKGAKIVERHFTLDKNQKGSDHKCSLDPQDMFAMICQIRLLEEALGSSEKKFLPSERPCFEKLGKSLVASRDLDCGEVLTEASFEVKVSTPHGWDPLKMDQVIGKRTVRAITKDQPITYECFD